MKKEGLFFTAIYALIFIPVIVMLVLTGVSMAEEIPPEETRAPIVTPMSMLPTITEEPATTPQPSSPSEEENASPKPAPVPHSSPTEEIMNHEPASAPARPEIEPPRTEGGPDVDDFIRETRYVIPMKAGEERTITVKVKSASEATYVLIPGLIISDPEDADELENCNDDWLWCFEEYESFTVSGDTTHEITFDLLPPEDIPNGTYEFNYELATEEGTTKKAICFIVTIYD